MKTKQVKVKWYPKTTIYITQGIATFKQLGFWYDEFETYVFVPAKRYGALIITEESEGLVPGESGQRFLIYRPRALSLDVPDSSQLSIETCDTDMLVQLATDTLPWSVLHDNGDNTIQHTVPR